MEKRFKAYSVVLQDGRLSRIPAQLVEKYSWDITQRRITPFSKLEIVEEEITQEELPSRKRRSR